MQFTDYINDWLMTFLQKGIESQLVCINQKLTKELMSLSLLEAWTLMMRSIVASDELWFARRNFLQQNINTYDHHQEMVEIRCLSSQEKDKLYLPIYQDSQSSVRWVKFVCCPVRATFLAADQGLSSVWFWPNYTRRTFLVQSVPSRFLDISLWALFIKQMASPFIHYPNK